MTKFPQGSEKHLIYAITKREVKSGALPASAGCIVDNVDTVVAIERAICKGRPLMRRIVTVSGKGIKNPGNYKIRIGMTLRDLVDAIGGFNEGANAPVKLIAGGPMMGPTLYTCLLYTSQPCPTKKFWQQSKMPALLVWAVRASPHM